MSSFSGIKNTLLAEQVEEQLYEYITKLPLKAGDKLPNEFKLAEMFGVGRSTVREAVKLLVSRNVLETRRGSGTYVKDLVPTDLDPLNLRNVEDKVTLAMNLVDLRLILEPGIAELAAYNATDEEIEHLKDLCDTVEYKIEHDLYYIQDDIDFHTYIARCSKNKVVEQIISIIETAVLMFVNLTHRRLRQETIITHRAITKSIANASIPTTQPVCYQPMFAAHGKAKQEACLTFVSQAAFDAGIKDAYGLEKTVVPVHGCRSISKKDMVWNDRTPVLTVDQIGRAHV